MAAATPLVVMKDGVFDVEDLRSGSERRLPESLEIVGVARDVAVHSVRGGQGVGRCGGAMV
jgi:hypothetical protein